MSRIEAQRSTAGTAFIAIGAGSLPLFAGLVLTLALADDSLRSENLRVGVRTVQQMDDLLGDVSTTADNLVAMTGKRCEEVLENMRRETTRNPWARSAALTYKGAPYCSTLSGKLAGPAPATARAEGAFDSYTLELRGPDNLSQGFGSLALAKSGASYGVKVIMDNRLLVDRLDLISGTTDAALNVDGVYLWDDGSLLRGELRQNPRYRAHVPSNRFNYAIHSSVSAEDVLNLIASKLIGILGTLVVVSILTGALCHWLLTRRGQQA